MGRRVSERVQAVLFVAVLVAAIAGLYTAAQVLQPPRVQTSVVHSVQLQVDGAAWSIAYGPSTTVNNSAFGLLREASVTLGFPLAYQTYEIPPGVFVLGINGSMNGDGGRYWQYWVNGAYGHVAADHRGLVDGDMVLWRFTIPAEGG